MPDLEEMTTTKAEEIAEQRYGREFNSLPPSLQYQVWSEAEKAILDKLAAQDDHHQDKLKIRRDGREESLWDRLELDRRLGK